MFKNKSKEESKMHSKKNDDKYLKDTMGMSQEELMKYNMKNEEKTLTIRDILMEDFNTNAVRDKLFLMDVKNRIHQDGNDFVRRILEDVNYINNGGRYDYALKQGEESKISSEAQEKAKEMVAILIPHVIQKAIAEIGAVVSLVKQNEEAPKEEEETKIVDSSISIRPASSNYFNY